MQIFHLIGGEKLPCSHSEVHTDNAGKIDMHCLYDSASRILFKVPRDRVNYVKYTREPYGER